MSQWHREHPELVGTAADPWMQHEDYRKAMAHEPVDDCGWCPDPSDYADEDQTDA